MGTASIWLAGMCAMPAQQIVTNAMPAAIERGTYQNYGDCNRAGYGIWSTLTDTSGVDTRMAQFLVGWDTVGAVPTNQPVTRYLLRHCRVTVTLSTGGQIVHDATHDDVHTYFKTNEPGYVNDSDLGRPIELFGAAFRNGFTATNYNQCSPLGSSAPGAKNVYGITWNTNGVPVDVGNNVGKTLPQFPVFEPWPFATAQTTDAAHGELMPSGARLTFDVNLDDPFVYGYVQSCLATGRVDFMMSSLQEVQGQFGGVFPVFATRFEQALLEPATTLDLDVTVVRDIDSEPDGLPDDWENFYFTNLTQTAGQDFDGDGANNRDEFLAGSNPTLAASIFQMSQSAPGTLRWQNLPGRHFSIEYSENLTSWQVITNPALIFPTAYEATWTDTNSASRRLYRVHAE